MIANDNIPPAKAKGKPVEAWSGKDKNDENFPVASLLIAANLRPHVHAYYNYARNADDIADSTELPAADKLARLGTMEDVLLGQQVNGSPSAEKLRESLARSGVPAIHARELLVAFRQDVTKNRYETWDELLAYCRYSAAPVGRYMLDLHGESHNTWDASDALCASLQVLNHLQDCAKDLINLDRCYVPQEWLQAQGLTTDALAGAVTSPALRLVFNQMLTATEALNRRAADLPRLVKSRRLRMECAIICHLAQRLTNLLKQGDPLASSVKLRKMDMLAATLNSLRYAA